MTSHRQHRQHWWYPWVKRSWPAEPIRFPLWLVLTIPVILISLGTSGLVGYLSWRNGQRCIDDLAKQLMAEVSHRVNLYLTHHLATPQRLNQANATAIQSNQINSQNVDQLEQHFLQQVLLLGQIKVYFSNPKGGIVGVGHDHRGITVATTDHNTQGTLRVYSLDDQGRRHQALVTHQNYDARLRPFYQAAVTAGKPTWSPVYVYTPADLGLGIAATYPLYTADHQLLGVLSSDLTLNTITDFLQELQVGKQGQVFIMERSGFLVADSTDDTVLQPGQDHPTHQRLLAADSPYPLIRLTTQQILSQFGDLNQIQTAQYLRFSLNGQRQFAWVVPYQDDLGLDWLIVTVVPASDFTASIDLNTRSTVILSLGALVVSVLAGLLLARWIAKPIQQLSRASYALATGQWDSTLKDSNLIKNSNHITELYVLAQSFYQTAEQLQQSFAQIKSALQESEEKFTKVFRTCPDAVSISTTDGVLMDVNDAFISLLGLSCRDAIVGRSTVDLDIWVNATERADYVQSVVTQGQIYSREYTLRHTSGRLITVLFSAESLELDGQLCIVEVAKDISDRKQNEEIIAQARERYLAILENQTELITCFQPGGVLTFVNDAFCRYYGEQRDELIGHTYQHKIFLPDQVLIDRCIAQLSPEHPVSTVEHRVITQGQIRWMQWVNRAIYDPQGNLIEYQSVGQDIDDRKQAEAALRQSEATKNQILKAIPDLLLWVTADGTCIDIAETADVVNLFSTSSIIGKNTFECLPPHLAQRRRQAVSQALQTGQVEIYEQQFTLAGVTYYEEVRVIAIAADKVLVIVRNIKDRKQAEAELRASEERFRQAFRDAPIGMALIGLDDHWLKVNPRLCAILGYTESELLAMPVSALAHPDDIHHLQRCLETVATHEQRSAHTELRYRSQGGSVGWVAISLSLVHDAHQQPTYYVAQIRDITEQKELDRIKDEFISIVSHELRTPLTAIHGALGLLNTDTYINHPNKAKRMLTLAMESSNRLVNLVNDILELERLSSGNMTLEMVVCAAADLLQQGIDEVQTIANQASIDLVVEPTDAQVWADCDAIIQVLTNLLSNAIKFSPPYSTVTLSAHTGFNAVIFAVQDHGRGIPTDKLEAIFGRFQQVDVSDARQKGGTGLGLPICQSIVQSHGGKIWVTSTLGQGSCFYFTLPIPQKQHD